MIDKSGGVDFDRNAFVRPEVPPTYPASRVGGLILGLALVGALAFVGYRLLPAASQTAAVSSDASLAEMDRRLSSIEDRLTKLEEERGVAGITAARRGESGRRTESADPPKQSPPSDRRSGTTVYRISPTPWQGSHPGPPSSASASGADPATTQRLSKLQQGVGQLEKDQAANNDAWQATTNRLADMAGQVGTQSVQILRSQDELNELVNRTEMEAIPFELLRGSNPTPVGPVSIVLKSTNPKKQSYTVCVYVQPKCIELKDRMIHEVVQFVAARHSAPLEIVATRIVKDEILGYLEVPRNQLPH
jgi:hypothetical protein